VLARLADRLTKLEQVENVRKMVYIVRYVSPGQPRREIHALRHGEERWERLEGETEDAFVARVRGEVARQISGVTYLISH